MIDDKVRQRLEAALEGAKVEVDGDGSRMSIAVISPQFAGMSRVKKQQTVYAAISELIASGELHAVTIKALTPEEAGEG